MKVSETFWLTVVGMMQYSCIFVGVALFFLIPKAGRRKYIELGLILIASFLSESIGWIGNFIFHKNMNLAGSILTLFYLPLTVLFYSKQVTWRYRNLIACSVVIAFEIFALINLFYFQGVHGANSFSRAFACFIYIVTTITYLFGYLMEVPKESRIKLPMYWLTIAFLGYNCIALYITLWIDYLIKELHSDLIDVLIVHNLVGLVYYGIIFHALLLARSQYILRSPTSN